jgi:hypothetical protein
VFVDTDRNVSTGDGGADYRIAVVSTAFNVSRWTGSAYETLAAPNATVGRVGGTWVIAVDLADFGRPTTFDFIVSARRIAGGTIESFDRAPDTGSYTYVPGRCIVPNVKGRTLAGARRVIAEAGCTTGKVSKRASKTRKGRVISQSPRAGRQLPERARVALVVSRGRGRK